MNDLPSKISRVLVEGRTFWSINNKFSFSLDKLNCLEDIGQLQLFSAQFMEIREDILKWGGELLRHLDIAYFPLQAHKVPMTHASFSHMINLRGFIYEHGARIHIRYDTSCISCEGCYRNNSYLPLDQRLQTLDGDLQDFTDAVTVLLNFIQRLEA